MMIPVVTSVTIDVLAAKLPASFLVGLHVCTSILSVLPKPPSNTLPINSS